MLRPSSTVRRRVALACGLGALLVAVGVTVALATSPGQNGSIAFRRYLDAKQTRAAVLTIAPDGSGERQIARPPAHTQDDMPDWSPDGQRIVFSRCPPDNVCRLMIVNADGTGLRALTRSCRTQPGPRGFHAPARTPRTRASRRTASTCCSRARPGA